MTIQLQDLKNDVTSNQVIRTSTQFNISKNLCNEINSILTIYRKRNVINKKKELMLNQEITNISHDLRTPLTAVKGYTDLLNDPHTTLKEKKDI
ncbi:histidine kinase dimerization/phospho-acceptor domain-containing protein [Staphylococcus epidermidis]